MYALSITQTTPPDAAPQVFNSDLMKYITALANADGPPPCENTIKHTFLENGYVSIRHTRYSNTLAVLERISNEFQDPTSNLYARETWALENNAEIAYSITEVDGPIDLPLEEPSPDTPS